jgi:S1-C subfamily serine protease
MVSVSSALDIGVLRLVANRPLRHLSVAASSDAPQLGGTVFTIGFPATNVLGRDPKYSEGTISGLSGLNGDASFYQVSVPIQPGNSGGPLVDDKGRVVGVVLSTASAPAFLKATGTLPQNVNWAVKSTFLAPLLPTTSTLPPAATRQDAIRRVTEATCFIEAS